MEENFHNCMNYILLYLQNNRELGYRSTGNTLMKESKFNKVIFFKVFMKTK